MTCVAFGLLTQTVRGWVGGPRLQKATLDSAAALLFGWAYCSLLTRQVRSCSNRRQKSGRFLCVRASCLARILTTFPFLFLRELQAVFLNAVYCLSAHPWSPLHLDCINLRPQFCALQFTLSCIGRLGGFNLHRYNFNFYGVLASPRQLLGGLASLPLPAATIFWPTLPGPLCGGSTCDGASSSASFTGWLLLAPLGFCSYVLSSPTGFL